MSIRLRMTVSNQGRRQKIFQGGGDQQKKTRPKNSTIKHPSALSVLRMKIQGGGVSLLLPTPMSRMTVTNSWKRCCYYYKKVLWRSI